MKPTMNATGRTLLLAIVASLPVQGVVADPQPNAIEGDVSDGNEITVRGSDFGSKSRAAPIFFDTQDEVWVNGQEFRPYANLSHGDTVPTGDSWPWAKGGQGPVSLWTTGGYRRYGFVFSDASPRDAWLEYPAGFPDPAAGAVDEVYLRWWVKTSFDPGDDSFSDDNSGTSAKFIRLWDSTGGQAKGLRISWTQMHMTGVGKACSEDGNVGDLPSWNDWGGKPGQWALMEFYLNIPTGTVRAWTNGKLIHRVDDFQTGTEWTCVGGEAVANGVHDGIQPRLWGLDGSGNRDWIGQTIEFSDYYADSTRARVEIGDAPRWNEVNVREVQVPVAWSDDVIRFVAHRGRLDALADQYLYVIDRNGRVNDVGLAIGVARPLPPTDLTAD